MKRKISTTQIAGMGILSALSVVFAFIIRFPIIPAAPYMEYDAADIPLFLATFMYGPTAGLVMTAIVSLIQGLTVSSGSGWVGILMHFLMTGTYVVIAGNIYKKHRTFKGAVISMCIGVIGWLAACIPGNLLFQPLFTPALTTKQVASMILPILLPFNLIKAVGNSLITILLYKRTKRLFQIIIPTHKTTPKPSQTTEHLTPQPQDNQTDSLPESFSDTQTDNVSDSLTENQTYNPPESLTDNQTDNLTDTSLHQNDQATDAKCDIE